MVELSADRMPGTCYIKLTKLTTVLSTSYFFSQKIMCSFSRSYNRTLIKQLVDLGEYIERMQQERQRLENR